MSDNSNKDNITPANAENIIGILKLRFANNLHRHSNITWDIVESRLLDKPQSLWSLNEMEISGGEPDVVDIDSITGEIIFFDCSKESPKGRRSLCYDQKALNERKEFKPVGSAISEASRMGVELLDEFQYTFLQSLETVDTKTSSWIKTPDDVRSLGGALFAEFRYGKSFTFHNGAQSYYAARGFRAVLKI